MKNSDRGDQNVDCGGDSIYRPSEIQEIFGIKQCTYYDRLKFLGMEANRDENGKPYLDKSQVDLLEKLDHYIHENGKMDGFQGRTNIMYPEN